jgi:hypothetical protein
VQHLQRSRRIVVLFFVTGFDLSIIHSVIPIWIFFQERARLRALECAPATAGTAPLYGVVDSIVKSLDPLRFCLFVGHRVHFVYSKSDVWDSMDFGGQKL